MSSRMRKLAKVITGDAQVEDEVSAVFAARFAEIARREIDERVGHIEAENAGWRAVAQQFTPADLDAVHSVLKNGNIWHSDSVVLSALVGKLEELLALREPT